MIKPFIKTTRCTVSTLSPVHIGCGEDYYPTNYVIDDGLLHHFSEEGLLAALSPSEKNALAKRTRNVPEKAPFPPHFLQIQLRNSGRKHEFERKWEL